MDLAWLGLTELKRLLDEGRLSSVELTDSLLARIARAEPHLHACVEVYAEPARALARAADQARSAAMPRSPLHGIPVLLKDLLDIEGRVCTLGSQRNLNRVATETAATVARLLAAGMVPLGKTHMTEFAFGGWGTNQWLGTPRNPWDTATHRVPGGSSSGTGVAIAAGYAPVGIGSDTGGSVRIPSAFNGLTGLKVTFGRISLHGTGLLSWTLDSIGPMARNVADWKGRVRAAWPGVRLYRVDMPERRLKFGGAIHIELAVQLNGLRPEDVAVEALFGRPGRNGGIGRVRHYPLTCVGEGEHGAMRYTLELTPELCGKLEYRIRAFPTHAALIHPLETGLMIWL